MKVTIITGSRADWNGLGMVGKDLRDHDVTVNVIAIGQHAESEASLRAIICDGFDPRLLRTNTKEDMAIGCGRAAIAVSGALASDRPNLVLLCGDRFEILGAASAAALHKIPIAHIGGGDITEGSIDDLLRDAITSLSQLHFATNWWAFERLKRNAGATNFIAVTGNPALDRIPITDFMTREQFFKTIGLKESAANILVAYHSPTREDDPAHGCAAMIAALSQLSNASFLILGTNSDAGSSEIALQLYHFGKSMSRAVLHDNLEPSLFFNALKHCDLMIGNSSAGLIETASFGIPAVNIGTRQRGRPAPDNVWHVAADAIVIELAVQSALGAARAPRHNPYGGGNSAPLISAKIIGYLSDWKDVSRGTIRNLERQQF